MTRVLLLLVAAAMLLAGGGAGPTYALRCLGGAQLTPSGTRTTPIRSGQAFVSIRTIELSPFGDGRIYFGGYDRNFYPADALPGSPARPAQRCT